MSNSLWPHGLQYARLPCPSLSPRVCSNSCPLNQWYHPTISSSVTSFYSCLQSYLASGSFPVSQTFASIGQSTGASASVLPMNIQCWFPLGIDWFDLCCPKDSRESSPAPWFKSSSSFNQKRCSQISVTWAPSTCNMTSRGSSQNYSDFSLLLCCANYLSSILCLLLLF